MKNFRIVAIAAVTFISVSLFAQEKCDKEQMIQTRANKMAEKLGLDDNTAAKFKEIYTEYAKEMQANCPFKAQKDMKADKAEKKAPKMKTDAEIDAQVKEQFAAQKKMLELNEKYYDKFRKVISARQAKRVINPQGMNGQRMGHKGNMGKGMHQGMRPQGMNHPGMNHQGMHQFGNHPQMGKCPNDGKCPNEGKCEKENKEKK